MSWRVTRDNILAGDEYETSTQCKSINRLPSNKKRAIVIDVAPSAQHKNEKKSDPSGQSGSKIDKRFAEPRPLGFPNYHVRPQARSRRPLSWPTHLVFFLTLIGVGLFYSGRVQAALASPTIRLVDTAGKTQATYALPKSLFRTGADISLADLDQNGTTEFVVAAVSGEPARVAILNADGTLQKRFSVLDGKFKGGLNVAVGDLDGDGLPDILISPRAGGGPQVEAYHADGQRFLRFIAYDPGFRGGVDAAIGDIDNDGEQDIITISGYESPGHLRVFTHRGAPRSLPIFPFGRRATYGGTIAAGDFVPDRPGDEIAIAPLGPGNAEIVLIDDAGRRLGRIQTPDRKPQGFTLAAADVDDALGDELVVATRHTNQVRIFRAAGSVVARFTAAAKNFRGEVALAGAPNRNIALVAVPQRAEGRTDLPRYIEIDLSGQTLRAYRLGVKVMEERVSTGKWSMPTPQGEFQTRSKIRTAYSRRYALYMDYWMAITPDGAYGIHSLPYWKTKNGIVYEGESHLGTPVSHGCIRLSPAAAKRLYDWAPVGTTVLIHR